MASSPFDVVIELYESAASGEDKECNVIMCCGSFIIISLILCIGILLLFG